MSELKPGDVVWIREQLIERPEYATDPDDSVYIAWGGIPMWSEPRFVIPDVPNLPAVARVLAEEPGMGAAVKRVVEFAYMTDSDDVDPYGPLPPLQFEDDIAVLRKLAAALNGGNHDAR